MLAVFHAYFVYLFTHIWSTTAGFPRISGLRLRINGLSNYRNFMNLKRICSILYACMNTLYG